MPHRQAIISRLEYRDRCPWAHDRWPSRATAIPKPGAPLPPIQEIRTHSTYDIRGNVLAVTDALGRDAFRYAYDLADRPWRNDSIDAGLRRMVLNVLGNEIERRDSKGALILQAYDRLQRTDPPLGAR